MIAAHRRRALSPRTGKTGATALEAALVGALDSGAAPFDTAPFGAAPFGAARFETARHPPLNTPLLCNRHLCALGDTIATNQVIGTEGRAASLPPLFARLSPPAPRRARQNRARPRTLCSRYGAPRSRDLLARRSARAIAAFDDTFEAGPPAGRQLREATHADR